MNIEKLEKELKEKAEDIVGEVGKYTSDTAYSPTGETFAHLGCQFKASDDVYLLEKWAIVIKGLVHSSLLKCGKKYRNIGEGDKPKLYWRIFPNIAQHPDKDLYNFRARLLVTCNCELKGD